MIKYLGLFLLSVNITTYAYSYNIIDNYGKNDRGDGQVLFVNRLPISTLLLPDDTDLDKLQSVNVICDVQSTYSDPDIISAGYLIAVSVDTDQFEIKTADTQQYVVLSFQNCRF